MSLIEGTNVTVGHLGVVAGMFDKLGIGEYIDQEIPKTRHHNVSHGTAVKALILNGLGFNEGRLYVMPEFFEDIAVERLLGENIKPEHLNEYLFGEALDSIAAYGPTRLFTGIITNMMNKMPLGTLRLHHDTTSINVTGEYDSDFHTRMIRIVRGHSKDHRKDLNQFLISLVTTQHGIPIFMEPLSGNESDKKSLLRSIQAVRANLVTNDIIYHMADSAFYTKQNISTLGQHCFWISHVPETINEAKNLCKQDVIWTLCTDIRYTYFAHSSSYGDIDQTWIMFHSIEQQKNREEKFSKKVKIQQKKDRTALKKLHVKGFACEVDARAITQRWLEKHPRYVIQDLVITKSNQKISPKPGRPSRDEPVDIVYKVSCKLEINPEFVAREKELLGRFILASNDTQINPELMLEYYKEQVTVERGFRFIKDRSFHVSEVYLKNDSRIAALAMLMVLCLLVYSVAEWQFRQILKEQKAFVRNQKNRPTNKPTMKRVFFFFRRVRQIQEIIEGKSACTLLNFGAESQEIVNLLGAPFNNYYV
jgi:transposase